MQLKLTKNNAVSIITPQYLFTFKQGADFLHNMNRPLPKVLSHYKLHIKQWDSQNYQHEEVRNQESA